VTTATGRQLAFDLDRLVSDCIDIAREEHGGVIRSKWAMGNRILSEFALIDPETGERKRIQYGALKAVAEGIEAEFGDGHGYGYSTLSDCLAFARRVPEHELTDAIRNFGSWFKISSELLRNGNVHFSSETPEWYTPWDVIERVQSLFGEIDLDPCSNPGVPIVPALAHFTENTDGLSQPWAGRVYMNPPYGRGIGEWVSKLAESYASGAVTEAVALVPARTDTEWFNQLRDGAVCFIRGRLRFSESETGAPFPSAAVYLGNRRDDFAEKFADVGDIWVRVDETA
jgi:phage N-6-adenine-methyltransferase